MFVCHFSKVESFIPFSANHIDNQQKKQQLLQFDVIAHVTKHDAVAYHQIFNSICSKNEIIQKNSIFFSSFE